MAEGTLLELTTAVHLESLESGMADAVSTVSSSAGMMMADFVKLAESTDGSVEQIQIDLAELKAGFAQLSAVVTEAMSNLGTATVAGTERAGEGLSELKREMAEVAEGAELSAAGVMSAFGGIGAIFGVSVFTNYLEGAKEAVLETHHLSELTGISVARLTEFKAAMATLGTPTENIGRILIHLTEQMQNAADGNAQAKQSFDQLGVSTEGWSKNLPDALNVLLSISDHLHDVKGNSDDAAASARVLGQRVGIEMAGGLTAGSEAITALMEKHRGLGEAATAAASDAARLQAAEAETSAKLQESMLPLLGFFADFITTTHALWVGLKDDMADVFGAMIALNETLARSLLGVLAIEQDITTFNWKKAEADYREFTDAIAAQWHQLGEQIRSENKEILDAAAMITAQPKGESAKEDRRERKPKDKTTSSSVVEQWREEIQQKIEAEGAGDEDALRMERDFWEAKAEEQKRGSALYLAAMRELTRAKHQLANEEYRDTIAQDRDIASLAATGSAERVRLEQKTLSDVAKTHKEGTSEYENQYKQVLHAQQEFNEEQVRTEIQSVEDQVSVAKQGSQERVTLLGTEMAKLHGVQDAANASASSAEQSGDTYRAELFRTYSIFVGKQIEDVKSKFITAQREMSSAASKQLDEIVNREVTVKLKTDQTTLEGPQVKASDQGPLAGREVSYETEKKEIEDLASLGLITDSQKIQRIREIEAQQHEATMRALEDEQKLIQVQILALSVGGGDTKKLETDYQNVSEKILQEKKKFDQQMNDSDLAMWQQQEQHAKQATDIIASSFQQAFGKILTTHTNFLSVMEGFWNDIVRGFGQMELQIIAKHIQTLAQTLLLDIEHAGKKKVIDDTSAAEQKTQEALGTAAHATQQAAQTAVTVTGQTAQTAAVTTGVAAQTTAKSAGASVSIGAQLIADFKSIESAAHTAAANAYKGVLLTIPAPLGIPIAAATAAAVFAAVLAFGSGGSASAEGGFDVPNMPGGGSILTQLHSREMVLPRELAENVRQITAGTSAAHVAMFDGVHGTQGASGGPGGDGAPGSAGGLGGFGLGGSATALGSAINALSATREPVRQVAASASEGFDVPNMPGGGSVQTDLHSKEMVLPRELAENVRQMTSGAHAAAMNGFSSLHTAMTEVLPDLSASMGELHQAFAAPNIGDAQNTSAPRSASASPVVAGAPAEAGVAGSPGGSGAPGQSAVGVASTSTASSQTGLTSQSSASSSTIAESLRQITSSASAVHSAGLAGISGFPSISVPNLGAALSTGALHNAANPISGGNGAPGGNGGPGGGGSAGAGSSSTTHNHFQINLHGGSADELRGMLDSELVPRIQRAVRNGALRV